MSPNALLDFSAFPRYSEITAGQVREAVEAILAEAESEIAIIAKTQQEPEWENVMRPLEDICENLSRVWNQVEHMYAVMNTADWCEAYQENLPQIAAFCSRLGQHEGIYQRMRALAQGAKFSHLSAAQKKVVTDSVRDFELSGVGLDADKKTLFCQNSERLAVLSADFEKNLLEATQDFSLTVDEAQIKEMPADLRAIAQEEARQNNEQGYRFNLQPPSYQAFMQYSSDRVAREKMYHAYVTRACEFDAPGRDNTPLLVEILQKRQQQAELLGFKNYAQAALEKRMVSSPQRVQSFLQDLAARAKPQADAEMAALKEFAAAELGIESLQSWDVSYAAEKLRQRRFDFSDADVRPYLQKDNILRGLFNCLQRLFGVTLRAQPEVSVWHEDVGFWEILNDRNQVIGGVYLDLYARKDKRSGAWMADSLSRVRKNNRLQLPLAHVVCNFSKPVDGRCALLNWDEAVTLFHEFGHAVHHLLTEMEEYSVSGISGVEWDAVELPSQWLENFVWEWTVVCEMTAHCDSGVPMPRTLFEKITAARKFHSGLWLMRQLEFALFDIRLHEAHCVDDGAVAELLQTVREQTSVLAPPAYNRFYCGFSHIFAGGYAAGYYSYLWAELLATDIFMMFKQSDPVLNRQLGETFYREILSVGGSRPAMESFIAVRGREPDTTPLLIHYGLAA